MLIYLVEDDTDQAKYISLALQNAGYFVSVYGDGASALRALQKAVPNAVILDRRLPDTDGLEVLKWVRKHYGDLPVLMLTNAILECDVVEALQAGADDYVVKPAKEAELAARVMALLRRTRGAVRTPGVIEIGPYSIDRAARRVYFKNLPIQLAPKEYELFDLLVSNIGRVVPRESVTTQLWGVSAELTNSRSLDTHIYRLRQKLNLTPETGLALRVIYGHGYRLEYL